MTFEEFNSRMNEYSDLMDAQLADMTEEEKEKLFDEIAEFQTDYMEQVRDGCDDVRIYNIFDYLINESSSGNVIYYVYTEDEARELEIKLWEQYGEYILDSTIRETTDEKFAVDIIFGGNYTPYWDGWED